MDREFPLTGLALGFVCLAACSGAEDGNGLEVLETLSSSVRPHLLIFPPEFFQSIQLFDIDGRAILVGRILRPRIERLAVVRLPLGEAMHSFFRLWITGSCPDRVISF